MRRAVPHGVGCEYPEYPTGVTASVLAVDWGAAVLKRTVPCEGCWLGRIEKQANHYVPVLRVRGGNKLGTAQATNGGALAYASDGELELRIADSVVSTTINGQVRAGSAQARPSCDA